MIVARGTITLEKLKELAKEHLEEKGSDENTITLSKLQDGSWEAKGIRFGREVETREYSPEIALQRLLTHG